ncbi:MAG: PQQ-dependent sugar dehydrogenase, partial [Actinomycetota bacterium]|nr:PQQ-dependent sugar dehydrogenase [Actinomycetota bacterium]
GGAGAGAPVAGVVANPFGGSFDNPVHVTGTSAFPELVYVTQQTGEVRVVENGVQREQPLIDVSNLITFGGEQGLLSTAFPPNFAETGRFYLYFTNRDCNEDTGGCDIEIAEFKIRDGNPRRADLSSHRTVLTIPHRDAGNHNGGTAAFGPDGKLWIATGDGGSGGDEFDNARRKKKLLGKLLRINPKKPKHGKLGYRIPNKNPFVDAAGRDEIWSVGLRNPFRFSFDGDDITIGDVGQSAREEVNIVPRKEAKGADFGWPAKEGELDFDPSRATDLPKIDPIHTYARPVQPPDGALRGITVNGGVIVRDPRLEGTDFDPDTGRYLFAETFATPRARSFIPDVAAQEISDLRGHPFADGTGQFVAGVSEDAQDRVYIAALNGTVVRIDPPPAPPRQGSPGVGDGRGEVELEQVGGGFDTPVNSAFAPGETDKVYVVEQGGTAEVVVGGTTQPEPFLDITGRTDESGEQGFLGMAFHPEFASNGLVYAYYTDEDNGDIVVDEFETESATDAIESSRRQVIRIRHRFAPNHNGGQVTFGPDGYMYLATGDGGSGDDPRENAQDKESLLGKLIRIDPREDGGDPYSIPAGNPFVGKKGDDEIYALGLRNPFRFNFEPESGNIMIGDVGQNRFEEVDIETADSLRKANFGWDRWEGFRRSDAGDTASKPSREDHDKPVLTYDHDEGASVIGGLVVRDEDLTNLYGRYLFTDFFATRLRSFVPQLTKVKNYRELDTPVDMISSFSEDPVTREVYVTSRSDEALYRLEPANP